MNGRTLANWLTAEDRALLDELKPGASTDSYREAMRRIGRSLACHVLQKCGDKSRDFVVVSTAEDSDFLTQGLIESLEAAMNPEKVHLICYWNKSGQIGDEKISTIVGEYDETKGNRLGDCIMVVVKSIIATACTVQTNIAESLDRAQPRQIFIAAPVMHEAAPGLLKAQFSIDQARRFEFVSMATDSEIDSAGVVHPGIGGMVYERLGIKKGRTFPAILEERRKRFLRTG